MVGNAIPPAFTYLLGQAVLGTERDQLRAFTHVGMSLSVPDVLPAITPPTSEGRTYSAKRSFRAAIPGLRFKSGMRFELANNTVTDPTWQVNFFYGPSHDIQQIALDQNLLNSLQGSTIVHRALMTCGASFSLAKADLEESAPLALQSAWSHRSKGMTPYDVADALGRLSAELQGQFTGGSKDVQHSIIGYVLKAAAGRADEDTVRGAKKLSDNSPAVLSGLIVGAWFNTLDWHARRSQAA
jgi:DNA (cytosine-5)-methyltransferase 1